jgi:4-amino-4-deoxy-L-arabinose transferase-like glycosyltransferase
MKPRYVLILLALAYASSLIAYSHFRLIDGDEGFYSTAARLVTEGKIPYKDFFYPQAPVLPFVYGGAVWLAGPNLASLRFVSIVFSLATVALWGWFLLKKYGNHRGVVFVAIGFLAFNPFFISWGVTVKTYALANLLATLALISVWHAVSSARRGWLVAAGFSSGLLVSTRLLYATVPLVILGWLIVRSMRADDRLCFRHTALFLLGMLAGCVPSMILFTHEPEVFVFNNIGYHLLQSDVPSVIEHGSGSLKSVLDLLLNHPYLSLQFLLACVGIYAVITFAGNEADYEKSFALLTITVVIAFLATTLIPSSLYEQYFTGPLAPFLTPLVAAGLYSLWERFRIAFFACGMAALTFSLAEFINEAGKASMSRVWTFESYSAIADSIKSHTLETDTVLSPWPGYVFESGRRYVPGLENHFGLLAAKKLTHEQQLRYHISGVDEIVATIQAREPEVVALGSWVTFLFSGLTDLERQALFNALLLNYRFIGEVGGVDLYERMPSPAQ